MIRVGIIDSGYSHYETDLIQESAAFVIEEDALWQADATPDQLGHGSHILDSVHQIAPDTQFLVAQVFQQSFATRTSQVVAAIDWLTEQGAEVINMSLGLRRNSPALETSIHNALRRGVVIAASSPAKGEPVYPAAYPGVFRMTGDARCRREQWSWLETEYADFGGYVRSADEQQAGASMGTARMTGHICNILQADKASHGRRTLSLYQLREELKFGSCFQGREFKRMDDASGASSQLQNQHHKAAL